MDRRGLLGAIASVVAFPLSLLGERKKPAFDASTKPLVSDGPLPEPAPPLLAVMLSRHFTCNYQDFGGLRYAIRLPRDRWTIERRYAGGFVTREETGDMNKVNAATAEAAKLFGRA